MEDLRGSIIKDGILTPLTVRKVNENHYELIDGERRLRLAKDLGFENVPCSVIDVDNETADRMVWKVNTLRKDYKPKEKAFHYKFHWDRDQSGNWIADNHDERRRTVTACINIFELPEKYQKRVWAGIFSIKHIELASEGHLLRDQGVAYATPEKLNSVLRWLDQTFDQHLSTIELEQAINGERALAQEERAKLAREKFRIEKPEIKIETPEDYDKAAEALKREAKKEERRGIDRRGKS